MIKLIAPDEDKIERFNMKRQISKSNKNISYESDSDYFSDDEDIYINEFKSDYKMVVDTGIDNLEEGKGKRLLDPAKKPKRKRFRSNCRRNKKDKNKLLPDFNENNKKNNDGLKGKSISNIIGLLKDEKGSKKRKVYANISVDSKKSLD